MWGWCCSHDNQNRGDVDEEGTQSSAGPWRKGQILGKKSGAGYWYIVVRSEKAQLHFSICCAWEWFMEIFMKLEEGVASKRKKNTAVEMIWRKKNARWQDFRARRSIYHIREEYCDVDCDTVGRKRLLGMEIRSVHVLILSYSNWKCHVWFWLARNQMRV